MGSSSSIGYRVHTALTSSPALSMAIEHNPDLILSDIRMSHGDGFEFIQTVKANPTLVRIPFVFLTSSMREEATAAEAWLWVRTNSSSGQSNLRNC